MEEQELVRLGRDGGEENDLHPVAREESLIREIFGDVVVAVARDLHRESGFVEFR